MLTTMTKSPTPSPVVEPRTIPATMDEVSSFPTSPTDRVNAITGFSCPAAGDIAYTGVGGDTRVRLTVLVPGEPFSGAVPLPAPATLSPTAGAPVAAPVDVRMLTEVVMDISLEDFRRLDLTAAYTVEAGESGV